GRCLLYRHHCPQHGIFFFFFSSRRRHTRSYGDWSSDVCSSDLNAGTKRVSNAMATASPAPVSSTSSEKSATTLNQSPICETGFGSEERRVGKECRARWAG